jgi:B9 domain-containing protein 1
MQQAPDSPSISTKLPSISHANAPHRVDNSNNNTNNFIISITGQIESCCFPGLHNLYCKYHFVHGVDWTVIDGLEQGISQIGTTLTESGSVVVLNFPLEIVYKSVNIFGWPQIVVSVYGPDFLGRDIVRGYGSFHVPTVPGRYSSTVPMFTPLPLSLMDRVATTLTGQVTEFYDSKFISRGTGREVTRVTSFGTIKMTWNVLVKNEEPFGYVLDSTQNK